MYLDEWIKRHIRDAKRNGKPMMLGEFAFAIKHSQQGLQEWTDAVFQEWRQTAATRVVLDPLRAAG